MDVGDLLNFKPHYNVKHKLDGASGSDRKANSSHPGKKRRLSAASEIYPPACIREAVYQNKKMQELAEYTSANTATISQSHLSEATAQLIEEKLGELDKKQDDSGTFDEMKLKKMVMNFDKKVLRNQEQRIKFPEDPNRFMDSEVELNESIEELHALATAPDMYSLLVELGSIKNLLGLLSHENTDIAIAVIDLLQEMTDVEVDEYSDGVDDLVGALSQGEIIAMLVYTLNRLDETNHRETEGVYHTLGIIENLTEIHPEFCNEASSGGLLSWLLKRLKLKGPFESNKLYASEILAICIQNNSANQKAVGSIEGIDVLLQQLAQYKRHDPTSNEEQEMMENLFDILCSCLLHEGNRDLFLNGEGLQLMNLMLREKKLSRNGALRVLDHALAGKEGADNCNKFVDILGLRTLFPLFMKTPVKHGRKGLSKEQHEEHVVSIIACLLRNCKSSQRQRLVNKFTENDHEKVDRLLELHFKFLDRVLTTNSALEEQAKAEDLDEDELYIKRLDGGLFTLQLVDYIMLDICGAGPPTIKRRVLKILNVRNASIKTIKNIIRDDVDDPDYEEEIISSSSEDFTPNNASISNIMQNDSQPNEDVSSGAKRLTNLSKHNKRSVSKDQRLKGLQYETAGGDNATARIMGPRCKSAFCLKSSRRSCSEIDDESREQIFKRFWSMNSWQERQSFFTALVSTEEIKQKKSESSKRNVSLSYSLHLKNGKILPVCKSFFASTFGIPLRTIGRWITGSSSDEAPTSKDQKVERLLP